MTPITGNRGVAAPLAIGVAAIRVPPENFFGEAQAPQRIRAGGKLQAARRHLKDVRATGGIEYVGAHKKMRERLTILAVADKPEARRRRHVTRDTAYMAAPAPKWKVKGMLGSLHGREARRYSS